MTKQNKDRVREEFYRIFGNRLPCMTGGTRARIGDWLEKVLQAERERTAEEIEGMRINEYRLDEDGNLCADSSRQNFINGYNEALTQAVKKVRE